MSEVELFLLKIGKVFFFLKAKLFVSGNSWIRAALSLPHPARLLLEAVLHMTLLDVAVFNNKAY